MRFVYHGGHDGEARSLRYLEWTWDPDPSDATYTVDFAYLLRETDGSVRVEHDRHICGLFARTEWLRILTEAGFQARVVPFQPSDLGPEGREVFLGVKPVRRGATGTDEMRLCAVFHQTGR